MTSHVAIKACKFSDVMKYSKFWTSGHLVCFYSRARIQWKGQILLFFLSFLLFSPLLPPLSFTLSPIVLFLNSYLLCHSVSPLLPSPPSLLFLFNLFLLFLLLNSSFFPRLASNLIKRLNLSMSIEFQCLWKHYTPSFLYKCIKLITYS